MNKYDKKYKESQLRILKDLENIYDDFINASVAAIILSHVSENEYFLFKNNPVLAKKIDELVRTTSINVKIYIDGQVSSVWELSNIKNDEMIDDMFSLKSVTPSSTLKDPNIQALKAFKESKTEGLTLSDRVWRSNANLRSELESSLNASIEKGQSAKSLAKDIKKYLNNPDMRFRRVRDKFGNLKPSKNALMYHPGAGIYRSSQANALRVAKETINRAYREADHLRWSQMPFVIGYKLRNSERKSTVCKICFQMNGAIFPKSYKFIGLHIGCLCTASAIMCSDEEFDKILEDKHYTPKQPDMPKKYYEYEAKQSKTI